MQAGVDQDGGGLDFHNASSLVAAGLLDEATVRTAATRLFTARMELGLLDPPETTPFQEPALSLDTDENRQASADAARQGIVLLANSKGALPLPAIQGAAVIGPNADNPSVLLGNYQGERVDPAGRADLPCSRTLRAARASSCHAMSHCRHSPVHHYAPRRAGARAGQQLGGGHVCARLP